MRTFSKLILLGAGLLTGFLTLQAAEKPDGAVLYKQKCSMCHGVNGKGYAAIHTPDMTDPKWQDSVKDKDITTVTKQGKEGTAMKGFSDKLKEDEIQALVEYIRGLNSNKKKP